MIFKYIMLTMFSVMLYANNVITGLIRGIS